MGVGSNNWSHTNEAHDEYGGMGGTSFGSLMGGMGAPTRGMGAPMGGIGAMGGMSFGIGAYGGMGCMGVMGGMSAPSGWHG